MLFYLIVISLLRRLSLRLSVRQRRKIQPDICQKSSQSDLISVGVLRQRKRLPDLLLQRHIFLRHRCKFRPSSREQRHDILFFDPAARHAADQRRIKNMYHMIAGSLSFRKCRRMQDIGIYQTAASFFQTPSGNSASGRAAIPPGYRTVLPHDASARAQNA